MSSLITLTTDFGTQDGYVGAMKGAILCVNPQVRIIDITHDIGPYDVMEGALVLRNACRLFPAGTIHVAVIDPGVGGTRRSLLLQTERYVFVGPDNGLFSFVADEQEEVMAVELREEKYWLSAISSTFHGRDIFAPVAGYLSLGIDPECFGLRVKDYGRMPWPQPAVTDDAVEGEVITIDRFGNLMTNIGRALVQTWAEHGRVRIEAGSQVIDRISRTYAEVEEGSVVAVWGSSGFLEISVNAGQANHSLGLGRHDAVRIRRIT